MTKAQFKTLAAGWQHYVKEMKPSPKEYHAHQRAFYAGALSFDAIAMNSVESLPEQESMARIEALRAEAHAFAKEQIAMHSPSINN